MAHDYSPRFFLLTPPFSPEQRSRHLRPVRASYELLNSHTPPPAPLFSTADIMETVNIPADNVPAELRACEQILKRAKELKKAEPVVAYWCCFSAAQKALKLQNRSQEGTRFLMILLDTLESMKAVLADQEAVSNEAAGAAHVENFALKVFMSADNDDRAGNTGKGTIRKFVVAGQFIEVLRCFENGMTEEMEQKLQYARWKAADGAKALREGRTPASGPPIPESEINPFPELPASSPGTASTQLQGSPAPTRGSFSSIQRPVISPPPNLHNGSPSGSTPTIVSPKPSPAGNPRATLPGIDTSSRDEGKPPGRTDSFASGAWSTVATPGLADDEGKEKRFNLNNQNQQTPTPSVPPPLDTEARSPSGDKKNVRFAGPDGAPLSPAHTHMTFDSYDAPTAPPPTTFADSPVDPAQSTSSSSMSKGDTSATSVGSNGNGYPYANVNSASSSSALAPPPPPSLATAPSVPPPVPQPHGLGLSSPPPSAPPAPAFAAAPPTRKQMEQTQKHARWAISALEFDDVETARAELRKALATIGG